MSFVVDRVVVWILVVGILIVVALGGFVCLLVYVVVWFG